MGATGPVFVEQLAAKDSIEEVMNTMNTGSHSKAEAHSGSKENHAKLHCLLKSAKLMRPPQEHKTKRRKIADGNAVNGVKTDNDKKPAAKVGAVRFKD